MAWLCYKKNSCKVFNLWVILHCVNDVRTSFRVGFFLACIVFFNLCVCVCVWAHATRHVWDSEDSLQESVLSPHHVCGSRGFDLRPSNEEQNTFTLLSRLPGPVGSAFRFTCLCLCTTHVQCLQRPEDDITCPRTGLTGGWELPGENRTWVLRENSKFS